MSSSNPCCSCGACCATFRVDFSAAELTGGNWAWGEGVPVEMTVPLSPQVVRMLGTDAAAPRCIALQGTVGKAVSCFIYTSRPSPCREFGPEHEACNLARKKRGLPPLAPV